MLMFTFNHFQFIPNCQSNGIWIISSFYCCIRLVSHLLYLYRFYHSNATRTWSVCNVMYHIVFRYFKHRFMYTNNISLIQILFKVKMCFFFLSVYIDYVTFVRLRQFFAKLINILFRFYFAEKGRFCSLYRYKTCYQGAKGNYFYFNQLLRDHKSWSLKRTGSIVSCLFLDGHVIELYLPIARTSNGYQQIFHVGKII